jgi:murein DD-endopeptidase MepM/ murein hydrolase activator NlpD
MAEKRWTFLCVSDDENRVRQYSLSRRALHYTGSTIAGVVVTVAAMAMMIVVDGAARHQARKLQREKVLLTEEVQQIQTRVSQMESSINGMIEQDERYRLLAGLDVIDEEIFQVGVGGPGMLTPRSSELWAGDPKSAELTFATSYDILALERRARLLSESLSEATDSLQSHKDLMEATPSIIPTEGLITSGFSYARIHPIYHTALPHEGIDLHALEGTPILAAANGVVSYVGWKTGYGNTVEVDHGFGYMTRYAHVSKFLVEKGQAVERGSALAQVGQTGTATADHLHYEVWEGGRAKNPQDYILNGMVP